MEFSWDKIDYKEDKHISYLLYLENKTVKQISMIRNIDEEVVKLHLLQTKKEITQLSIKENTHIGIYEYLSFSKPDRESYLYNMTEDFKEMFIKEIYSPLDNTKNIDDLMVLIWTIGELKIDKFNKQLKYFSSHPHGNIRRMVFSAMGKINSVEFLPYIIQGMKDKKPQVKQYAIIAFGKTADISQIGKLKEITNNSIEKDYIKRAAEQAEQFIREKN